MSNQESGNPADRVEELRHRIEGSVQVLASTFGVFDVRTTLADVQALAVMALDACGETTSGVKENPEKSGRKTSVIQD